MYSLTHVGQNIYGLIAFAFERTGSLLLTARMFSMLLWREVWFFPTTVPRQKMTTLASVRYFKS